MAEPASAPPVSAAPPGFSAVLERLPPRARPPAEHGLSWIRSSTDGLSGAQVVEVIGREAPPNDDAEWLQVEYTVDPELDERVREVLARRQVALGHLILMDPATGEIFSYVSTDPEAFPPTRVYPTASLMKVVTAAAALRRAPGLATRECRYKGNPYVVGRAQLVPPVSGGRIDPLRHALAISNNQCFGRLAVRDVGEEALLGEMRSVGLLEIPAAQHAAGRVDPIDDNLDLAHLGSGLAGSFVTPLAAARLAALLARGELVHPYWIARVRDARGDPLELPEGPEPRSVWPSPIADELREVMVAVTEEGTARNAFLDPEGTPLLGSIRVAGKTGTLSGTDPEGLYQWFIGVAPAEQPSIAIASIVLNARQAGSASQVAAESLYEIFCRPGPCAAAQGERLHARASARKVAARRELAAIRESSDLDEVPRPLGFQDFEFPPQLLREKADGEIVLLVDLNPEGQVLDVQIDSSDLPAFEQFVASEVRSWIFSPPTRRGRPVAARARLPIPIRIE